MSATYTQDGDNEFELVYEIPADADAEHTVWLESDDEKVGIPLKEFEAEWREFDYDDHMANNLAPTQYRA